RPHDRLQARNTRRKYRRRHSSNRCPKTGRQEGGGGKAAGRGDAGTRGRALSKIKVDGSAFMNPQAILDHISRLPHGCANYKQLVRELGARGEERRELDRLLGSLVERGRLIETKSGHYMLTERQNEYAAGRLMLHRDGYGFVIPDPPPGGGPLP